jgi:hypothetical protein
MLFAFSSRLILATTATSLASISLTDYVREGIFVIFEEQSTH